jgi:pyroglutamyl-peptidase
MKILMTGFSPFPGVEINPTELVIRYYQDAAIPLPQHVTLIAEVLPTVFDLAGSRIRQLIRDERPDAILCLGVAQKRAEINLERVAHNWDEARIPDNTGVQRAGQKIVPDGADNYVTTLRVDHIKSCLDAANIETVLSDDAGRYVCNHVFYSARHEIDLLQLDIPCGFVHVPGLAGTGEFPGWDMEKLVETVKCCLEVIGRAYA